MPFLLAADDPAHAEVMALHWMPAVTTLVVFLLARVRSRKHLLHADDLGAPVGRFATLA